MAKKVNGFASAMNEALMGRPANDLPVNPPEKEKNTEKEVEASVNKTYEKPATLQEPPAAVDEPIPLKKKTSNRGGIDLAVNKKVRKMENRSFYVSSEVYKALSENAKANGCSISEYLNIILERAFDL